MKLIVLSPSTMSSVRGCRLQWCLRIRNQHVVIHFWKVGWVFLLLISFITSSVSGSTDGFISISCGGEEGIDRLIPELQWTTDDKVLDSAAQLKAEGVAIRTSVGLDESKASTRDNADQLKTAMAFLPGRSLRSKYCYVFIMPLQHSYNTSNYLVRVMFPSKNLKAMDVDEDLTIYGKRFYFTVDSTVISVVDLDKEDTQTIELVVNSLDDVLYICLVPLEDRSSMAAISTIEIRPMAEDWYYRDTNAKSSVNMQGNKRMRTSYLITVVRLNFGGNISSPSVRFPGDVGDRLWYPAVIPDDKLGEIVPRANSNIGKFPEYEKTAWEGVNMSTTFSFTVDIRAAQAKRAMRSFFAQMVFVDLTEASGRVVDVLLETRGPGGGNTILWYEGLDVPKSAMWLYSSQEPFNGDNITFTIRRNETSAYPVMINGLDILGEFDAVTQRTLDTDASIVKGFYEPFKGDFKIDTAGDPCLPVPWYGLACSIDATPRITEVNLTSKGIKRNLSDFFGSLDRPAVLDLSNNSFSGELPNSSKNIGTFRAVKIDYNNLSGEFPVFNETAFVNLEALSLSHNNFSGDLYFLIQALNTPIFSLDLSYNRFNGSIPARIGELKNLKFLDLSYNGLSGALPLELFQLPKLEVLNLDSNNFTEVHLTSWVQKVLANGSSSMIKVSLLGNPISNVVLSEDDLDISSFCTGSASIAMSVILGPSPWCSNKKSSDGTMLERYLCRTGTWDFGFCINRSSKDKALEISMGIIGPLFLILNCVLAVIMRRMLKRMKDLRRVQDALAKEDVRPPFYKYEDLKAATNDFSNENELGKGAFGAVYKADLVDGSVVAVKSLFPTKQNIEDFLKEMVLITGIKHKNLIQLKGCCIRNNKRMLVYEYADNGNLAEALWGKNRSIVLTWEQRLKISVGIAKGLSYLHEELQPKIIHRDIKPQNILLDNDWNPKIADFGLARPLHDDSTLIATSIGGTKGYVSPEYATQGLLTEKLDVYSYGILLLEIISGRQWLRINENTDEIYLKDWAVKCYKEDSLSRIAEKSLLKSVSSEEIESLARTALKCIHHEHEKRPSMSQVVTMIAGDVSDVAVDILEELKNRPSSFEGLYDTQRNGCSETISTLQ
ncbi:hypothetical protein R1flu_013399 [Riccia fluitans]|uniref:Protein kinase domain-containing protein n=1 Tax=Riccia fluitans TaxID=41844 RepID=A0ABD1YD77_9MARC